jgi:hypothetical protein
MSTTDKSDNSNNSDNSDNSDRSTTDKSDNSTASGAQVAANNGGTANDSRDSSTKASNRGTGSVANGGDASYVDSSMDVRGSARAGTGAAATNNQFGAGAVVSSATLASYVTGVTVSFTVPDRTNGTGPDNSLSIGGSAFQNFAGIQSLNANSGVAASQNSTVNVSVSAGAINLNP